VIFYLGLGSNLEPRLGHLRRAWGKLVERGYGILALSGIYETLPWGYRRQPLFLNLALTLRAEVDPSSLLRELKEIEREVGRTPSRRWGPRAIDLDILAAEGFTCRTETLILPHPRLVRRPFALLPLAEIAPRLLLPGKGRVEKIAARMGWEGVFFWGRMLPGGRCIRRRAPFGRACLPVPLRLLHPGRSPRFGPGRRS
jgi:2-amino-4-hydroxy-6-hydroxymethyldihydropteridine diphosphokinase